MLLACNTTSRLLFDYKNKFTQNNCKSTLMGSLGKRANWVTWRGTVRHLQQKGVGCTVRGVPCCQQKLLCPMKRSVILFNVLLQRGFTPALNLILVRSETLTSKAEASISRRLLPPHVASPCCSTGSHWPQLLILYNGLFSMCLDPVQSGNHLLLHCEMMG